MAFVTDTLSDARGRSDGERRSRIVEAARRAFVRLGFRATTMQHVADEAGMSAGNLYRYFASKEALVEGLCIQDHDERAANFLALVSRTDVFAAIETTLRENVVGVGREKALLIVEIWAEAGRNARVAEITRQFDAANFEGLCKLLDAAKSSGALARSLDAEFVARTMFMLVAGIFKGIAIEPGFDARREAEMAVAILRGLLSGAISSPARLLTEAL